MSKHTYEVVVGNVGTVYNGPSLDEAEDWYDSYARASERTRVVGEDVLLLKDGEAMSYAEVCEDGHMERTNFYPNVRMTRPKRARSKHRRS